MHKMHEAGHLDTTKLMPDSLTRLTLRWGHLMLGMSWCGEHFDANLMIAVFWLQRRF